MKKKSYTKAALVRELAFNTGITQKKTREILDALCQIVYREARDQGITIPGICRLDVVRRKARRLKNPQTRELILIAEHDSLRVRALKKARNIVTPPPENFVTVLETLETPSIHDDFSKAVSFCCKKCRQEIEAPLSAAGMTAECPSCGNAVKIPSESEPGTLHGTPVAAATPPPTVPPPSVPPTPAAGQQPTASPSVPPAPASSVPPAPAAGQQTASPSAPPPAASAPVGQQPGLSPSATGQLPLPPTSEMQGKSQTIRIDLAALGFEKESGRASKPAPRKRMLSFFCKNCRQEIEAPAEMAGSATECPTCGVGFEVPFFSDPGTLHGSDLEHKKLDAATIKDIKNRTIRIEVPDDL